MSLLVCVGGLGVCWGRPWEAPLGPHLLMSLCSWSRTGGLGFPRPSPRRAAVPLPWAWTLEPHSCALPTVDRESGRLAGQGVPAGRPQQARIPRAGPHAAPMALPRAEVLLPHLCWPAHRGALQHHPRLARPPGAPSLASTLNLGWGSGTHRPRTASASGRRGAVSAPSLCTGPWALLRPSSPQGGCAQVCGSLRAQGPHQPPRRASLCGLWRCGRSPSRPPSSCLWAHHMCTYQDQLLPTDFPDSRPAVEDLKYCLERTDQRPQLLVSLRAALETRLLHPGAAAGPPTFALRAQTRDLRVT